MDTFVMGGLLGSGGRVWLDESYVSAERVQLAGARRGDGGLHCSETNGAASATVVA